MSFVEAVISVFFQYVGFGGRACRSEYWYWVLFTFLASIATAILDMIFFPGNELSPINALFGLATLLPSLAVGARRLHDINRSGWWLLLWFVPIVGWILLIVWAATKGDERSNRFGDDPIAMQKNLQPQPLSY